MIDSFSVPMGADTGMKSNIYLEMFRMKIWMLALRSLGNEDEDELHLHTYTHTHTHTHTETTVVT